MNKLEIIEHKLYEKSFKKLSKKFRNIGKDMDAFLSSVETKDDLGVELKADIYKARIANTDKNRGKGGEYRLFTYMAVVRNELHLLYI